MDANNHTSHSRATTLEDVGAFWDTHDFTDYDTDAPDTVVTFRHTIAIEMTLYTALEHEAHARGVSTETLINLWLQQKLRDDRQAA